MERSASSTWAPDTSRGSDRRQPRRFSSAKVARSVDQVTRPATAFARERGARPRGRAPVDLGGGGTKEHASGGSPGRLGGEPGECEQDQRQDEQHEVEAPPHRQAAAAGSPGSPAYVGWKPRSRPTG